MRLVFICHTVDEDDDINPTLAHWVRALADHEAVERMLVLTLRIGRFDPPANMELVDLGPGRVGRLLRFYRAVLGAVRRGQADFFLVAQSGPYPVLLLPIKVLTRRRIYQWKTHSHITRIQRFSARYCDDIVFTATPSSFPMRLPNISVVGHGIDTELFRPAPPADNGSQRDLIAVGRIAPEKCLERLVRAAAALRDSGALGRPFSLDLYGPAPREVDRRYQAELEQLIERLGLSDHVRFCGSIHQSDMPSLLGRYRAAISFTSTALDKTMAEAMACGLPVVSSNPCLAEILPDDLRALLMVEEDDLAGQATVMAKVLAWDPATREMMGQRLRAIIVEHHGLDRFWDKILTQIAADAPDARR